MRKMLSIAITLMGLLAACSRTEPAPEPVRAVRVQTIQADSAGGRHEYAAEVRARTESRLGFRVGGKIVRRNVDAGDTVKAGQVLAQLDPRDLRLGQEAAHAALSAAQVNLDQASADFRRYKDLRDKDFISSAELERRDTALKAAQAALEQARAQANVQGNQAAYSALVADAGGVITGVEAEPGSVVSAGMPVLRLAHDGPRDVVFAVPEDKLAELRAAAARPGRPAGAHLGYRRRAVECGRARSRCRHGPDDAHLPRQGRYRQCAGQARPDRDRAARAAARRRNDQAPADRGDGAAGQDLGLAARPGDD